MQQPPLVADEEEAYEFKDDEIKTDPLRSKNKSDSPEAVVPSESPEIPGYILFCCVNITNLIVDHLNF